MKRLIFACLVLFFSCYDLAAQSPVEDRFPTSNFSTESLKKDINEALKIIESLKSKKIRVLENGVSDIFVTKPELEAFHFIQASRSPEAVSLIIPFIDVLFSVVDKQALNPKPRMEHAADLTLKVIGLPSVDGILQSIKEKKIESKKLKAARKICVDVLGQEGLVFRAKFLGLSDDENVKKFLKVSSEDK